MNLDPGGSPAANSPVVVSGSGLRIEDLIRVSRRHAPVRMAADPEVQVRLRASSDWVRDAVARGESIYGVTSGFGGMAHVAVAPEQAAALQTNLLRFLRSGTGRRLSEAEVRAAMLLRANALMRGASGIRPELIERLVEFLNAGATPHVHELGSIGASGDLVPLASIAGALVGLDTTFRVDWRGETLDAPAVLERLGLPPLALEAKEGLALLNGTSVLTAIAAGCVHDGQTALALTLAAHALLMQGLAASNQPLHPFIHGHKPHPGQVFVAARMLALLEGSGLIRDELDPHHNHPAGEGIQDRYSIRCLPQFLGPIVDGMAVIASQVEVEMNAATDNPLFDPAGGLCLHGGNFLGQYVAMGMDQLRQYLSLLAKHLDAQIALLVEPAFNAGLPESLAGNPDRLVNMGLKGLQITGNSIMPLICHLGQPLADRFPTHAEQYNQNISSLGLGAATLARQSLELYQNYLAVALIFGVQAVDLRSRLHSGRCDARAALAPVMVPLYEAVVALSGRQPKPGQPFLFNDDEQPLEWDLAAITADLREGGSLAEAVTPLTTALRGHHPYARES